MCNMRSRCLLKFINVYKDLCVSFEDSHAPIHTQIQRNWNTWKTNLQMDISNLNKQSEFLHKYYSSTL